MSDATKRDEWDQHNRDEANERAAQQAAAGPTHRPVPTEPYAGLAAPATPDAPGDIAGFMDVYERAAAAERLAWLAARERVADADGAEAWNAWRDAVERTQQAARALVDCQSGRGQPPTPPNS